MIAAALAAVVSASVAASTGELPLPLEPIPRWELGAAAGGGWDSNPLAEASPSGSGFASARAWVGRRFDLSDSDELRLQLHYDGLRYDAASAADLDRPELGLEWDHFFGDQLLLRVIGRGALRYQGDPARDGSDTSARVLLRIPLGEVVGLRGGLGGFYRDARDAAFAGGSGRADVGVDVGLWRRASAVAGYAFELGTDFSSTTMGSGGKGRGMSGLGALMTRHSLSADLFQGLPGGLFLQGGYGYSLERGPGLSAEAHLVMLELGWRR
jgi:hypothetical protein